jgi:hypothetical protein
VRLLLHKLADKLNHPLLELLSFDLVADNVVHDANQRRDVLLEHRSPVRGRLLHAWQARAAFGAPVVRALFVHAARHVSANPHTRMRVHVKSN